MTPDDITAFLDGSLHRFDRAAQFLGDEPGGSGKRWDDTKVRWLLAASWPYFHSAGNQSIPAVCYAINSGSPSWLADRSYLPETPRDLKILEKAGVPVFGVETRHQLLDFDVAATSISYMVLFMNFCNAGEAPIWMADKTFKPLSKVQVGDEVIGWEWGSPPYGGRRLRKSRVLAVHARQAPVVKVTMESGKIIRCTPDHRWLSPNDQPRNKRQDSFTHVGGLSTAYAAKVRTPDNRLGTLAEIVSPGPVLSPEQQREADWLAGVYDGEGSVNCIAQSLTHNPEMCERIERAFTVLGIPLKTYDQENGVRKFFMAGGRQTYVNWLNWTNGTKRAWFEKQVMGRMLRHRDRVMRIEPDGIDTVYSMETETGNYVAWGYASKNCKLLTASGVPLRRSERAARGREHYPLVMVGGQAYGAPGAMEPVVDCVWLGEVEDEAGNGGIAQVCRMIEGLKREGAWQTDRGGCYERLAANFNHLYFPEFTEVDYGYEDRGLEHPSKVVTAIRSVLPAQRYPLTARKVKDMDAIKPLPYAPLLWADPSMGAGDIEEARGCPAWCSFCRLSWETKPYRQRSVDKAVAHAREWQQNMGTVELSPFGPDFPMFTQKKLLLSRLLTEVGDEIDGTAMRIDDFIADEQYVMVQAAGGADAVTLGLEGNSQRMRDLVGKGTSDADVEKAVITGIRVGFRKFKLYMITNLPGENEGDVLRIVRLGQRLNQIRQDMGQPNVRFQFSWTPLLIEAQTPFQWFAPTPPDHTLINVADLFRDLKIEFKIGTKAEPNKVALFQLMQRASREVGEAIVDVFERYGVGSWGGVPPAMKESLETALKEHGFLNGLADLFDERYRTDLFGWEHISTGVSPQLLWDTYRQMLEFLLYTESDSYDELVGPDYHGQEFVARCDTQCLGRTCGVCDKEDLELRRRYITAPEIDLDISQLQKVDQTSIAFRVRFAVDKAREDHRFVSNDSWRFLVRRAAYRSAARLDIPGISKRSIKLASDGMRVREHTSGRDYIDFGMTRPLDEHMLEYFMQGVAEECDQWLLLGPETTYPRSVTPPVFDLALYEQPVLDADSIAARLRWWSEQEEIPLRLRLAADYFGGTEEIADARALAPALWLVRDGDRILLRSLVRRAGPAHILMALTGKPSLIEAAAQPARRVEYYLTGTGECEGCGMPVPVPVLGDEYPDECPSCFDKRSAQVIAMSRVVAGV